MTQTDSLMADFTFYVEQARNNEGFECPAIAVPVPETGTLTLLKTVVNDNTGSAADTEFTLEAVGPESVSGVEGDAAISSATVLAGTYNLSETGGPAGYTASDWVCSGAALQDDADTVTVAAGEDVTCTITNDDIVPIQ